MTFAVLLLKDKDDKQLQLTADPGESHTEETLEEPTGKKIDLVYSLNDRPPWYLCILLGFQVNVSDDLFSPVSQQKTVSNLATTAGKHSAFIYWTSLISCSSGGRAGHLLIERLVGQACLLESACRGILGQYSKPQVAFQYIHCESVTVRKTALRCRKKVLVWMGE